MLSNATSTASIHPLQRKQKQRRRRRGPNRDVTKETRNENQSDQPIRGRPGEGSALLHERTGICKKTDFSNGPYRWLTVASPEEPDGTELQLTLNNNPAAKTYQQAMFQQSQPGAMFFTDDVKGDYERIKARGAEFTMPPT